MDTMNIFKAITDIMAEVSPIAKGRKNTQQNFMYRGVDDVMNELQPLLAKHHVFIVPEVIESMRSERQSKSGGPLFSVIQRVKFTFYADDGSSITAIVEGEGMDSGDKASNKALAVAFKYACFQVFCIPTDDPKDPDADSHEVAGSRQTAANQPSVNPPATNPPPVKPPPSTAELVALKEALIDFMNMDPPVFNYPDNVQKAMDDNDIDAMRKALVAAKARQAERGAKNARH